jgi:hypothetical protein
MWLAVIPNHNSREYGTTYFSMSLGWCWIPAGVKRDGLPRVAAGFARFFCSYAVPLVMIIVAIVAYRRNKQLTATSGSFSWHLKPVVLARFVLLCFFPALAYVVGFIARYDDGSLDRTLYDVVASFLLSSLGGINALVFLATEKASLALMCGDEYLVGTGFSAVVLGVEFHSVAVGVPARDTTGSQPIPESQQLLVPADGHSYEALQAAVVMPHSLRTIRSVQ